MLTRPIGLQKKVLAEWGNVCQQSAVGDYSQMLDVSSVPYFEIHGETRSMGFRVKVYITIQKFQ